MSLLVTGGAGFIGSNFVRRRRAERPGEKLVVLDALTYAGNLASLQSMEGFVRGDICDGPLVEKLLAEHGIDQRIVHFAAESHVDRSILGPAAFVQTNVVGTATLLEKARAAGVQKFLHVSTDEVYGDLGPEDPAFTEETPIRPRSPYSASKAGSDHLVRAYFETYGFPALMTRCSNNYGPYQFPEKLIPLMILNAMDDHPLPVYGDGRNVRDWIHVEDHCAAIERVLESGRAGEVYNIGGRAERRNIDIVKAILNALGKPESLIRFVADRPGHDRRYAINDRKIERELGWTRRWDFERGLQATIEWYREHSDWVGAVRSGDYRNWYERNLRIARMTAVVLGAGGLLGRHLVEELGARGFDRAACDIARYEDVARSCDGASAIVNCAAYTNVDGAESNEDEAYRANALGAENVARAAARRGVPLVHLSTDFVFDGVKSEPYDEFDRPNPLSVYARSKRAGEELVLSSGAKYFLVRVQGLYGAGGRNFSSRLRALIAEGKPLKLDCERRVQPTWARAAARQIARLLSTENYGIYHVSCKGAATWAEFARHVAARLKVEPRWEEVPTSALSAPAARPPNCLFRHRMLELRGLDVMPDWRAALDEYLKEES